MEEIREHSPQPHIERIRAVNHHLRTAIDRVSDGVLIVESEPLKASGPRVIFINQAGRRITGFGAEDILGQPLGMLYADRGALAAFLARLPAVAETAKTYQMPMDTIFSDGSCETLRWTVTAVCEPGRALNYVLTMSPPQVALDAGHEEDSPEEDSSEEDSSEEDSSEEDSSEDGEVASSSEFEARAPRGGDAMTNDQIHSSKMESLALVASGIAHDFNNILTTVVANLSLAKLETSIDTEVRQHVDDATMACDSAKALIQQLLAFARGDVPVKKETHIGKLLNEAVRLATYGANVRCETTVPPDLWSAEVDRTQVTQVLSNLLINARQAMPNGGIIQAVAENTLVTPHDGLNVAPGNYLVITVRDRGCGIPDVNLKRIFDPFFTTKKQGSGLGLATSYSLVQKHGGTILVRSKEHKGTEFRVFLPATGRASEAHSHKSEELLIAGEGTILVVDDQESVRAVAAAILEKLGYKPLTSSSGQEAVEVYTERMRSGQPVTAILMDMTLPGGMSGEDTFDEIRRIDGSVCSIATSGYFDDDSHERFIERGFGGLLPKPYTAETLSQILHDVLTKKPDALGAVVGRD